MAVDLKSDLAAVERDLIALRRHLHAHPELSFEERETARFITEHLQKIGIPARSVFNTGVVGVLRGGQPGRTIMYRADIDALPIHEANEVDYRSRRDGTMHACGHDGHTALALTVADILARRRDELPGNVVFCFQPAEERFGGAKPMIEAGVMEDPKVDAVIGLHLWTDAPAGKLGVRVGAQMASADEIRFAVKGAKAHGAMPHQGVDAIVIAAEVIGALQTLVARETSPFAPAVVTIGTIHGGQAFNIIADRVELTGTLRTFDAALRERLARRIGEVAQGVARALGGDCDYTYVEGSPPVVNEAGMVELVRAVGAEVLGAENVYEPEPTTGGDDMAFFMERAPGVYFFFGSGDRAKGRGSPHHTDTFDLDESCLLPAAEVMVTAIRRYLGAG